MFATESSLAQLKPETILGLLMEAEEKQWMQVDMTVTRETSSSGSVCGLAELGTVLLGFGSAVKKIEGYFSHLELRKCCLLLAGRRTTFSNVRLVNHNNEAGLEDGITRSSAANAEVGHLNTKEFQAFKHAYLSATFPVLGVPDPPSPLSPSPVSTPTDTTLQFPVASERSATPCSLHDSGVEAEHDDASVIPTEALCDILRKSFRLSTDKFTQYEKEIVRMYHMKTAPELLAEDLVAQLTALETNSNRFYSPHNFLSRYGYDVWQHRERTQIAELLNKFWHFALPFPADSRSHLMELNSVHDDYEILLSKILMYEKQFKNAREDCVHPVIMPLSSASMRLLREFGLRYGIGEQFRKILYVRHIVQNFNPCIWYLNHVVCLLTSIRDCLPSNQSQLIMVRQEFLVLDSAIKTILTQTSKTFCQIKSLFPKDKAVQGIELMVSLISLTLELRAYLTLEKQEPIEKFLYTAIQGVFRPAYEHHKVVARSEMQQNSESENCPILLNIVIGNIRDEVVEYKNTYQAVFESYLNISETAAQFFYMMLMDDVKQLCCRDSTGESGEEIDLLMLGLIYRLNQLDQDWASFIPPEAQAWRSLLEGHIFQWCSVLKHHMQNLVLEAVACDRTQQVHLDRPMSEMSGYTPVLQPQTPSFPTFTPSLNSAFSSLLSSTPSTLSSKQDTMHADGQAHAASITGRTEESNLLHTQLQTITQSPVVGGPDQHTTPTAECDDDSVSIVVLRHSSSLPNMNRRKSTKNLHFACTPVGRKPAGYFPVICGDLHGDINDYEERISVQNIPDSDSLAEFSEGIDEAGLEVCSVQSVDVERHLNVSVEQMDINEKKLAGSASRQQSSNSDEFYNSSGANTLTPSFSNTPESTDHVFPPLKQLPSNHYQQDENIDESNRKPNHFLKSIFSAFRPSPELLPKDLYERDHYESGIVGSPDGSLKGLLSDHMNVLHSGQYCSEDRRPGNHDDFLDSFQSNITLPSPPEESDTSLPMSSSIIDMVTLLQRLVGFGSTLYRCLCFINDEKEIKLATKQGEITVEQMEFYRCKMLRSQLLFEKFLEVVCYSVSLYSDNIFCLDLCGTPSSVAKQVIGPKLVENLTSQRNRRVIWGCRHEQMANVDCRHYIDKNSVYLCDRYEPITQQMCTRINDVAAITQFLRVFVRKLASAFKMKCDWERTHRLHAGGRDRHDLLSGRESQLSAAVECDDYSSDSDALQSEQTCCEPLNSQSQTQWVKEIVEPHECHLKELLRAQIRLMAYRLNLFIQNALSVLLDLKDPTTSIDDCLQPLTKFLHNYLGRFSEWLYHDNFRQVLECLWIYIVQDFEKEADQLKDANVHASQKARTLIEAIAHLIQFMNNFRKGISRSLLLSQAETVIFRLELYTLSTCHLLTIYTSLTHLCSVDSSTSVKSTIPAYILQKLHSDLQTVRKCFTGCDLVRWILHNRQLVLHIEPALVEREPFSRQLAVGVAQKLLDMHLISDLDVLDSDNSYDLDDVQYPEITLKPRYENKTEWETCADSTALPNAENDFAHDEACDAPVTEKIRCDKTSLSGRAAHLNVVSLSKQELLDNQCDGVNSAIPVNQNGSSKALQTFHHTKAVQKNVSAIDALKNNTDVSELENNTDVSELENNTNVSELENNTHVSELENNTDVSELENNTDVSELENNTHVSELENNTHVGELENNTDVSELENNTDVSELENNTHVSELENNTHVGELENNTDVSELENNTHVSELKNNTHVSELENNTHVSELENNIDAKAVENNTHVSELEKNSHVSVLEKKSDIGVLEKKSDISVLEKKSDISVLEKKSDISVLEKKSDISVLEKINVAKAMERNTAIYSGGSGLQTEDVSYQQEPNLPQLSTVHSESYENHQTDSVDILTTPVSFLNEELLQFEDSCQCFYRVIPCAVEESLHTRIPSSLENILQSHSSSFKNCHHSITIASLVEQCFQRKITSVFLLTIIYGRKKHDHLAKDFMKQMPTQLIDKIKAHLDLPGNHCVGC